MRNGRLQDALQKLKEALHEVDAALDEISTAHDPLALHIFTSRRQYLQMRETKSGKRHELAARLSWQRARQLGFQDDLGQWHRLMAAVPRR